MIAVDTNVVVRIVTRDDRTQAKRAIEAVRGKQVWVAKTVLLETAWVLRHAYDLRPEAIVRTLRALLGYARLDVEDRDDVEKAIDWFAAGMDFADALHLASSGSAERLLTFDDRFGRKAASTAAAPPVEVLDS